MGSSLSFLLKIQMSQVPLRSEVKLVLGYIVENCEVHLEEHLGIAHRGTDRVAAAEEVDLVQAFETLPHQQFCQVMVNDLVFAVGVEPVERFVTPQREHQFLLARPSLNLQPQLNRKVCELLLPDTQLAVIINQNTEGSKRRLLNLELILLRPAASLNFFAGLELGLKKRENPV
jgi:hypothetical protein